MPALFFFGWANPHNHPRTAANILTLKNMLRITLIIAMVLWKEAVALGCCSRLSKMAAFRPGSQRFCPLPSQDRTRGTSSLTTVFLHPHRRPSCLLALPPSLTPPNSPPPSLQDRIEYLTSHPAVAWDGSSTLASARKKKLGRRHLPLFVDRGAEDEGVNGGGGKGDRLFNQFARAVCNAGADVARKEIFETWAAALHMHHSTFEDARHVARRLADVAAGHGLLAWALLILDDERRRWGENQTREEEVPLTAFCLDVKMPRSAELLRASMVREWPHLESRFDYVEGRLEQLVPHPSCLLVSVHACGILSDILVATAAKSGVPLAIVPCCHTRKRKVLDVASPYATKAYEDIILGTKGGMPDLAERLDGARVSALQNAGLEVYEEFLPILFTGKNRLIMGFPAVLQRKNDDLASANQVSDRPKRPRLQKGWMPPLGIMPKDRFLKGFYVPCEDAEEPRDLVCRLAGKLEADRRKEVMHNRRHAEYPQMDLSLWLPQDDVGLSERSLSGLVESEVDSVHEVKCIVSKLGGVYTNPSGRKAQTFRICYKNSDERAVLSFEEAKKMHEELYRLIPKAFPGAECR